MKKTETIFLILLPVLLLSIQVPTFFFTKNIENQRLGGRANGMPPVEVTAQVAGSLPQVEVGYCQLGQSTVTFTNLGMGGQPAASVIHDISVGIALGENFQLSEGVFEITGIRVAGVDMSAFNAMNDLGTSAEFSSDPDGPGGLTDADGDGFFDDLEINGSVEITAFYRFDCAAANALGGGCLNNLSATLNARMAYAEQGAAQLFELPEYAQIQHQNTGVENSSDGDALLSVDTFHIVHRQSRLLNGFDGFCSGEGRFEIQLALPVGIEPVMDEISFWHNGTEVPLFSSVSTVGVLGLNFDAASILEPSGDFELRLAFFGDCFVPPGPSNFPITFRYYCPSCDCAHLWYCGTLPGPQLHITSPPCPIEEVLPCDKGVRTLGFEVERTTFGFSDPGYSSPISPQAANQKVALGCDSVQMQLLAVVGTNPIPDSVGIVVTYDNPDGSDAADEVFLFDQGTVRFTHLGGEFFCPVDPSHLTVENLSGKKTLTFDLNDCLLGLGFTISPGDTIEFTGQFSVNPDGPFPATFSEVPNFRSYAYVQQSGQVFICDNYGAEFYLGKTEATYNLTTSQPMGCGNGELNFRLAMPPNDFGIFFGNEYRASNQVSSFSLDFDPLILQVYDSIKVEAAIPGHPVFGDNFFPIRPLSDFPSGNYVAEFDTLAHIPALNILDESSFEIRIFLTPNCQAETQGVLDFSTQINFRDRVYAEAIGSGECAFDRTENEGGTLEYSFSPFLVFNPLSPHSDTVQNMPAGWIFQLCNDSPIADAEVVWLAIENPSGQLLGLTLTDVTVPGDPQLLPLEIFPEGVFAYLPAPPPGGCAELEISASLNECATVGFSIFSGWNCSLFDLSDWNPFTDNLCQETSLGLQLVNELPAPLSVDFQEIMSECDGAGGELISISGTLKSMDLLSPDDFSLVFVFDENGNGEVDAGEPILATEILSGTLEPGSPLPFEITFLATPGQACQILLSVTATATELCEDVLLPLPLPQILNAGVDAFPCTLSGNTFTAPIGISACENGDYTFSWTAVPPANMDDLADPSSNQTGIEVEWDDLLGDTLIYILETERNACGLSTFDTVEIHLPTAAFGFFEGDSTVMQLTDCQGFVEVCLGVSDSELPNLQITNNGLPYPSAALVPCADTLNAVQLGRGYHQLVATDTVRGCSDSLFVKVQCNETETIVIDLLLNEADTICFENDELTGAIETLENFCFDGTFVEYEIFEDSCLILTGNWVGSEMACVEACDNIGFCDTTFLEINVLHPLPNGIKDSIVIEQLDEYCFDENLLNIGGPIVSIENLCPSQGGNAVDFAINDTTQCIEYFGTNLGLDSACVELCDALGNCDTLTVCVSVIPGDVIFDTLFIEVDTNVFCLEDSLLPGTIISVEDICPENNGDEVQFVIEGQCIFYFGDVVGVDTACIRFEDDLGNVGLINLIATVVRTIPETICDSVFIGEIRTICLDTVELPGRFTYIEEICPDERTGSVDVFIDPVSLCVDYEGLAEGRDSACIVVCDDFGFCDTTFLCLTVPEFFDLPTLGNDTTATQKGTPVVIDFLANDTLFGGITEIFILDPPISGTAVLNLQNSFTYTPDEPFCARWDNFTYVACNPNGCDTATVSIFIECIELTVFSAVSPNNDGVNDFFHIAKIEDFPDNNLWVYNRWGNLVFEKNNYKNNWPATWGEDIELPDGTYYYILEWSDGGTVTVQRGYIEMFR